ncbi:MAG: undecaprenyldiphospho-muramoylpentapeptide beta-N-acetylglucosaminyltransferase [Bdellovibrionales bacterium]|nr:undecaprenyldiphospho-muramoylpentapeptide beta-N-acetylglucosaminyltransferase [Bdellovibrionales bacterium]
MPQKGDLIVITGGGTGGHIFPALAIADELKSRGLRILYVGSPDSMESRIVPSRGYDFVPMRSIQVKNKNPFGILLGVFTLAISCLRAASLLRRKKPKAVIGVGGYASVPIGVASFLTRIPLYLQEQNASVGIANRFLGKFAKRVFLGFEKAQAYFPKGRSLVSGNPVRKEIAQAPFPDASWNPPCLFVFGGSQGARAINSAIVELLPKIHQKCPHLKIIHQTGTADYERIRALYTNQYDQVEVVPFIDDMAACYKMASLVVCRSGALTVSELIAARRPAILVPYPRKGQNDQTANAYLLEEAGVGKVVEQGPQFEQRFWAALESAMNPQTHENMVKNYSQLRAFDALATIGDHLVGTVANSKEQPRNVQ